MSFQYGPAFKALCKDLLSTVNPKHTFVCLAYQFQFHSWTSKAKVDLPLSFEFGGWSAAVGSGGSSSPLIQPWVAFKIALAALIPAVNQEEDYIRVCMYVCMYVYVYISYVNLVM